VCADPSCATADDVPLNLHCLVTTPPKKLREINNYKQLLHFYREVLQFLRSDFQMPSRYLLSLKPSVRVPNETLFGAGVT
jgi:hypothetical protein